MHFKALVSCLLLSSASALAYPRSLGLHIRSESDCSETAPFAASCWGTNGIQDWLTRWNQSTPLCSAGRSNGTSSTSQSIGNSTNGKDCCFGDELWSDCFLRLRYMSAGHTCSTLNPQSCSWESIRSQELGADAPQKYYVLRAIFTINNLITSYYTALKYAIQSADLTIQDLVNQVDELKAQSPLLNILSGLIAGLGFLGLPSIGAGLVTAEISATIRYASQSTVVSLQQAPGLVKSLWPSGSTDSRSIQVANLATELSRANTDLSDRLTGALSLIMGDVPTFLQFAQGGKWTTSDIFSIDKNEQSILIALHNYLLSEVLSKNGWYGFVDRGSLDPTKFPTIDALESSKFQGGIKCDRTTNICSRQLLPVPKPGEPGYNGANYRNAVTVPRPDVPAAWWYSNATKRVFTIKKPGMSSTLGTKEVMQKVISQKWGTLDVLFDGSYNCTFQGRSGGVAIDINGDGNLDMSCISQLPIKRECQDTDPCFQGSNMGSDGKTCPFQKLKDCEIHASVKWPPGS